MGGPGGLITCSASGCSAYGGRGTNLSPVNFIDIQVGGPLKKSDMMGITLGGPSAYQREQARIAESNEHAGKQARLSKRQAKKDAKLDSAIIKMEAKELIEQGIDPKKAWEMARDNNTFKSAKRLEQDKQRAAATIPTQVTQEVAAESTAAMGLEIRKSP